MAARLTDLTEEVVDLETIFAACAVDEDGVVAAPESLLEDLDKARGTFDRKVEACAVRYLALSHESARAKKEAKRLEARSAALEAEAERLRALVCLCLQQRFGLHDSEDIADVDAKHRQVRTALATATLQAGDEYVDVTDLAAVPTEYRRPPAPPPRPEEWPADKVAAKPVLKAGTAIPGLSLVRGAPRLSIR